MAYHARKCNVFNNLRTNKKGILNFRRTRQENNILGFHML